MHRKPESLRKRIRAILIALAVLAGAAFVSANIAAPIRPAASDTPAVAGTYTCVVVSDGDGQFHQDCTPVSPSGSPTATPTPPSPTATPTPTATSTPTPTPTTPPPTPTPTPTTPSPTPTPTPTPTGPQLGCVAHPSACGFPDATNTGVPAGTVLTVVNGNQIYSTPGQVVSNMDIRGCVSIKADNVVIRNTRITCTSGDTGIKTYEGGNRSGIVVQDTEIDGGNKSYNGISYGGFTLLRVNIHGFENGIAWSANPGAVRDSYIHDLTCAVTSSGNCSGGQHPDGMQFSAGQADVTIDHNTIVAPITNSAIIMYDDPGDQNARVTINNNILAGGGFSLYTPRNPASDIVITNNRFGPANFGACSCYAVGVTTWSGNIYDATGKTVPLA